MNFCRRREKHPILLQNKHNRGCDGSSSHQGQQALWAPPPRSWRRDGGREDVAAEGGASSSLRCFQSTPRCGQVKVITLQLNIKMSLGREPQHNRSDKQRKARAPYPLKACASRPISACTRVIHDKYIS